MQMYVLEIKERDNGDISLIQDEDMVFISQEQIQVVIDELTKLKK